MNIAKKKIREIVLQLIYAREISGEPLESLVTIVMGLLEVSKKNAYIAFDFAEAILAKQEEIDAIISDSSEDYLLERISIIDKNILRMAIFELIVDKTDIRIVIDESIRLSKKFSTPEASGFVHAVIDTIGKNLNVLLTTA